MHRFEHLLRLQECILESKVLTAFLCCCPLISGASLVNNAWTWSSLLAFGEAMRRRNGLHWQSNTVQACEAQELVLCRRTQHNLLCMYLRDQPRRCVPQALASFICNVVSGSGYFSLGLAVGQRLSLMHSMSKPKLADPVQNAVR